MRRCRFCGARLPAGDRFCDHCGTELAPPRRRWAPVAVAVMAGIALLSAYFLLPRGSGPGFGGQIVDALTGSPVAGAAIRASGREAVSDGEGCFVLDQAGAGRVTVRVTAGGYEPLTVRLAGGERPDDLVVAMLPAPLWSEVFPVPRDAEVTMDTGSGLKVAVAVAGRAWKLTVRDHGVGAGQPDAPVTLHRVFSLELDGPPAPGKRQVTLTFDLPPGVDPASAVILRWTEERWCLAVPGDDPGDLAALGGVLTADGRAITVDLDSLSTYALATFRQELQAFPISTRVLSQDFDADGNLVVEVLLEQPRQLLGFVGAWYEVEVRDRINLLSVSAPDDRLFGLPAWSEGSEGRGFIAPGETKRLVLVFPGTGGSAQIHCDLYGGLPMAATDWVCRLATGSNLPWPLTVTGVVATAAEPLVDLVGFLREADLGRQVQLAAKGVSWGATALQGPRAVLERVQTEVVEYATKRGLEGLYDYFGKTLGRTDWTGRPLGKAQAWSKEAAALWLRFIRTTDMAVSTAAHAAMGYHYHTGTVSGYAGVKVVVEPAAAEVRAGESVRFTARVTTLDGSREVTVPFVRWEVGGGGTVAQNGTFTAAPTAGGTFRVTAVTAGADLDGNPRRIEGTAQVKVIPQAPVAAITVTHPSGGETWQQDAVRTIRWTSTGVTGEVKIELSRNGGATWEVLAAGAPNTGARTWTVTGPATSTALVRVSSVGDPSKAGTSGQFAISWATAAVPDRVVRVLVDGLSLRLWTTGENRPPLGGLIGRPPEHGGSEYWESASDPLRRGDILKLVSERSQVADPLHPRPQSTHAIEVELTDGTRGWLVAQWTHGLNSVRLAEVIGTADLNRPLPDPPQFVNVAGAWSGTWTQGSASSPFELDLTPHSSYTFSGAGSEDGGRVTFSIGGSIFEDQVFFLKFYTPEEYVTYSGTMKGDTMSGSWSAGWRSGTWSARRAGGTAAAPGVLGALAPWVRHLAWVNR